MGENESVNEEETDMSIHFTINCVLPFFCYFIIAFAF